MIMSPANKKYCCHQRVVRNIMKLTIGVGLISSIYVWTNQPDTSKKGSSNPRRSGHTVAIQWAKEFNSDEHRIAQQFEIDTLLGLMRRGLIKKYERRQTGTILFVAGKVWQERSRFFKDSLLSAVLVYNKVNGYALETRVVDNRSQQLYAHAISEDRKEFFD
jgi:hypothetical protein